MHGGNARDRRGEIHGQAGPPHGKQEPSRRDRPIAPCSKTSRRRAASWSTRACSTPPATSPCAIRTIPKRFLMSRSLAPQLVHGRRHHGVRSRLRWRSTRTAATASSSASCTARFIKKRAGRHGGGAQPFGVGDSVRAHQHADARDVSQRRVSRRRRAGVRHPREIRRDRYRDQHAEPRARRSPQVLADKPVALLRAHGMVAVGPTPAGRGVPRDLHRRQRAHPAPGARARRTDRRARSPRRAGSPTWSTCKTVGRSWDLWKRRVMT